MLLQHDLTVLGQNGSVLPVESADMKFKMENSALFGKWFGLAPYSTAKKILKNGANSVGRKVNEKHFSVFPHIAYPLVDSPFHPFIY